MKRINKDKFKVGLDALVNHVKDIQAFETDNLGFYGTMRTAEYFMSIGFLDALIKFDYVSDEFKEDIENICAFSKSQIEFETELYDITTSQKFEEVTV